MRKKAVVTIIRRPTPLCGNTCHFFQKFDDLKDKRNDIFFGLHLK